MNKALRWSVLGAAAVVGLLLLVAAIVALRFDPNEHKAWLIERVQQAQQRSLAIPGRIALSFFPGLGLQVGELSLSERGGPGRFASVRSLRVSLAVLPLLRGRLVVDHVEADGLTLQVRRHADGSTSIDDLLALPERPLAEPPAADAGQADGGRELRFDIAGIVLQDAALQFDDGLAGRSVALSGIALRTGRIRAGEAVELELGAHVRADEPTLDADLRLQGSLLLGAAGSRQAPRGLVVEASGVELTLRGRLADGNLDAKLQLPKVRLTGEALAAGATQARVAWRQGETALDADLTMDWTADLPARAFELTALRLNARLPNPRGGTVALQAQGDARAALAAAAGPQLRARLQGEFDGSRFDALLAKPGAASTAWRADLDIDRLDLDRYLAPSAASAASAPPASGSGTAIDLSMLQGLEASGTLRVGALRLMHVDVSDLQAGLRARGGRLDVDPLGFKLYQGLASGKLSALHGAPPQLMLKQRLAAVAVGPLLQATLGQDRLSGRGDVDLDLRAQGAGMEALKRSLAGSARLALRDGAVRGFDIAQALRSARAALGRAPAAEALAGRRLRTDFSELSGSFVIADGVARTHDLAAKSPLLRVGVQGTVDLGAGRLDMAVRATVVDTLKGQGGPELQALRGATLPVRLTGPFDDVDVKVDLAGAVQGLAGDKAEDAARELKEKAREKLGEKLKGLLGR